MNKQKRVAIKRCAVVPTTRTYVLILVVILVATAVSGTPLLLETFAAVVASMVPLTRCVRTAVAPARTH